MRARLVITMVLLAFVFVGSGTAATSAAQKVQAYERQAEKHKTTLRFFEKRQWMTAPRHAKCWQVTGWKRRQVCRIARREVAEHTARLANVRRVLAKLASVQGPIGNKGNWLCIYSHEKGAARWETNTGNGYFGGLQMDRSFQRAHGLDLYVSKGTANNWTPYEQMVVAERAHDGVRTDYRDGKIVLWQDRARGYNPWPRTARLCGLL